jgi:hypothetical protein
MLGFVETPPTVGCAAVIVKDGGVRFLALDEGTGSDPVVGLRGGFDERQNLGGVKAKGAAKHDQLDDIDPALAAFDAGDEGLVAFELERQLLLREARPDASLDESLAECHLSFASDRFRHAPHTSCDVASGGNLLSKK